MSNTTVTTTDTVITGLMSFLVIFLFNACRAVLVMMALNVLNHIWPYIPALGFVQTLIILMGIRGFISNFVIKQAK